VKLVHLTRAQTEALLSVIGEVLASSPSEWGSATGRTLRQAERDMAVLGRAQVTLENSYPDKENPDA
jgi:hypothetical protein